MRQLIAMFTDRAIDTPCALCQRPTHFSSGLRIVDIESSTPVCEDCGRTHALPLATLLQLARTAERIGRIALHGRCVSMESNLELARAAEIYTNVLAAWSRQRS